MEKHYLIENKSLMLEWDWDKNNSLGLDPTKLTFGSNKRAYWKCPKCGYSWDSKINNRATLLRRCPCCCNRVIVKGVNDLQTLRPDLAKEWDYNKNDITPDKISVANGRKVWWLCPLGHSYQATVLHRSYGDGTKCPICNSGRQTSFAEQCVYYYVKKEYPDAINRYKADWLDNFELDIYIPSINYAIEYDGYAWHKKEKLEREQRKYNCCNQHHTKLVRIREKFPPLGSDIADYEIGNNLRLYESKNLEDVIRQLLSMITFHSFKNFDINIERDRIDILQYMVGSTKNSFADKYPEIAKEWNYEKNGELKPDMFLPYSDTKVWWTCPSCGLEYESSIGHRSYGTGCPKCAIKQNSERRWKKVAKLDDDNNIIETFDSLSEAEQATGINPSNISMVCKGQRSKAGGYRWKYLDNK